MNLSRNKVRYAVVGLGHIAQVAVLPAFKAARNSELFALVSGDPAKLRKLGKKYNLAHLYPYEEYSRALSNVDAVFLALPFLNVVRFDIPRQRFYFAGVELWINEFAIIFFALMFLSGLQLAG